MRFWVRAQAFRVEEKVYPSEGVFCLDFISAYNCSASSGILLQMKPMITVFHTAVEARGRLSRRWRASRGCPCWHSWLRRVRMVTPPLGFRATTGSGTGTGTGTGTTGEAITLISFFSSHSHCYLFIHWALPTTKISYIYPKHYTKSG